jgi:transcription antitermination factor NusG
VASFQTHLEYMAPAAQMDLAADESQWYAVHTMPRHEKRVAAQFQEKQVSTFLPLLRQINRWSDRRCTVEIPMFSCYAFVRMVQTTNERLKVLRTPGVLGFVGNERQGTPIPKEQIENLRAAISGDNPCEPHPFLKAGKRVRVCGGALDGVEGILVRQGEDQSLVVSIELLSRSVSVRVQGYRVELI